MKNLSVLLITLFFATNIFSQNKYINLMAKHRVLTAEECKANEKYVIEVADYLINNPIDKLDNDRQYAFNYIQTWMNRTPDYMFNLQSKAAKVAGYDQNIKAIHYALLAKYALTHQKIDGKTIEKEVLLKLLDYIDNPKNNVKKTSIMNKNLKAKNDGTLN